MVFQLQKYLNDLLQNIGLRTRKEERNGGRGRKEEKKKENRRKVTTNFDVSFMTYRKTSMRQTIILALASTKFCDPACQH